MKAIQIDGQNIGRAFSPYVIAELSANHNGSIDRALKTIEMAKASGASAIKMQTYTADTMTINCDREDFQISGGLWDGYSLYDLYQSAHTPYEWHRVMFDKARELGITIFSTPFDDTAVDLLESLGAPAYKIASFEVTDLDLIKRVAHTGKPLIMSTGMANLEEIKEAVATARNSGCEQLAVLHCISGYPTPVEQANLLTINSIAKEFECVVGLSDHTLGTAVSVSAVSLGASIIEKHVTLSRKDKGPDSEFSLEPNELKTLCEDARSAWQSLGTASYECKPVEAENIKFRRSLYFVKELKAGEVIRTEHIRKIRPGFGLAPKFFEQIVGQTLITNVDRGEPVSWKVFKSKDE